PLGFAPTLVRRTARRRWWLLAGGTAALLLFRWTGASAVATSTVAEYFGLGAALTFGLATLARRGVKGSAAAVASVLLDLLLAVVPAAIIGVPGLGILPFIALAPYTEADDGAFGVGAALATGVGLLAGHALRDGVTGIPAPILAEAGLITVVALGFRATGRRRARRIEALRRATELAAQGDFSGRLASDEVDPLGEVERGFDLLSIRTAGAMETLGREANEVAALAEQLAASVEHLERAATALSGASGSLAHDLQAQRTLAEESRRETEGAAQEAGQQRQRALLLADDTTRLVTVAERARQSVARASETLVAVGAEVSTTANVVNDLTTMSARIGNFTRTMAGIARQTHLLSLNAAIEAARAEGEGQGFGVVAEEVRTLAAEAGRSAREVSDLVAELQEGIGGAARAMNAGREQVEDVARVAREADDALRELAEGVRRSSDRVGALAGGSRAQADHLQSLRGALEQVSRTSQGAAANSDGAAKAATEQSLAIQELARAAGQLAGLAERLRGAVKR
ncbi:MAG TPA: methyl-accepting chemotaxis protein, partial [Gemmatimonadales bacterium]|nr:methyl-accepting chemotaxis protein [Gemmatimonadales bacterium]